MGGILIGNGIGPERVFKSTERYEVDEKYLVEPESAIPAAPEADQAASKVPEHIGAASQYGFWVSLLILLSVLWLWQMRTKGVYLFTLVYSVNIVTLFIWKPEWIIANQTSIWFSLLLAAVYFSIVLPHWKTLSIPLKERPEEPEEEPLGLDVFKIGTRPNPLQNQKTEKS
ncbi:MAG: hypothetical protein L3J26_09200 [Candidatus Polarisedimenticolaceae bacterium]|nr:hypothetical protein [Candidatus Polarisedimenticolaceae bacterium]